MPGGVAVRDCVASTRGAGAARHGTSPPHPPLASAALNVPPEPVPVERLRRSRQPVDVRPPFAHPRVDNRVEMGRVAPPGTVMEVFPVAHRLHHTPFPIHHRQPELGHVEDLQEHAEARGQAPRLDPAHRGVVQTGHAGKLPLAEVGPATDAPNQPGDRKPVTVRRALGSAVVPKPAVAPFLTHGASLTRSATHGNTPASGCG